MIHAEVARGKGGFYHKFDNGIVAVIGRCGCGYVAVPEVSLLRYLGSR